MTAAKTGGDKGGKKEVIIIARIDIVANKSIRNKIIRNRFMNIGD